jgi:geranylgeranylglycerol-phosphate geranylgeranyltransferase
LNQKHNHPSRVFSYFRIIRPLNCFFGSLTVVVGMFNAFSNLDFFLNPINIITLIGGLCVYILIAASANVLNDIFDINIDAINRPDRPIPSGAIKKKQAILYAILLMSFGIILSIPLGLATPNPILIPIFAVFFSGFGFLYNWKGKQSGFLGNIMVGIAFSSGIPFGAFLIATISEIPLYLWFFILTAIFLLISRELVKGMEDIEGDSKFGQKTVVIKHGFEFTAYISAFFSIAAISTFTIPVFIFSLNWGFIVIMSFGNVFVLGSIMFLIKPDRKENQTRASLCLKIGAYLGLIAYILAIF